MCWKSQLVSSGAVLEFSEDLTECIVVIDVCSFKKNTYLYLCVCFENVYMHAPHVCPPEAKRGS